jgi:hypothetical protein
MNIRELAAEAGFSDADDKGVWITDGYWDKELTRFAALVAAHEREECAKMFEPVHIDRSTPLVHFSLQDTAKIIRARGRA